MVISDSVGGGIEQFFLTEKVVQVIVVAIVVLFVAIISCFGYNKVVLSKERESYIALQSLADQLKGENTQLLVQNDDLSTKVTVLSDTVNKKVENEEEQAEKYMPTGFPLDSTAMIEADTVDDTENTDAENADDENADDKATDVENTDTEITGNANDAQEAETVDAAGNPIIVFITGAGTSVIASGNGTILKVTSDEEYGNVVKIDHENGYISIYRTNSTPKVKEGDEVTRGTVLFEMEENSAKLGYQIQQDEAYIDPLTLLEIRG